MDVFLRVRDLTDEEINDKHEKCVKITECSSKIIVRLPKDSGSLKNVQSRSNILHEFTFSRIFGPEVDQHQFYESTTHKIVKRFLGGNNCLVFACGEVDSGKTDSTQGLLSNLGLLQRSIEVIFNSIGNQLVKVTNFRPDNFDEIVQLSRRTLTLEKKFNDQLLNFNIESQDKSSMNPTSSNSNNLDCNAVSGQSYEYFASLRKNRVKEELRVNVQKKDGRFLVWISFAELYNERVYDLLQFSSYRLRKHNLKLAEDHQGNVFIQGLRRVRVSNPIDAFKLLTIGQQNLRFCEKKLHKSSSTGHCIFTIEVACVTTAKNSRIVKVSKLSFCELAGSETKNLDSSFLVLGRCLSMLKTNQSSKSDSMESIPFRESKLTRLFKNFLVKDDLVSMIVNISPDAAMYDESLQVLHFSALAQKVVIVPVEENKMPPEESSMSQMDSLSMLPESNESALEIGEGETSVKSYADLYECLDSFIEKIAKLEKENRLLEIKIRKDASQATNASLIETEEYKSPQMLENRKPIQKHTDLLPNIKKRRRSSDSNVDDNDCNLKDELAKKDNKIQELILVNEELNAKIQMLKDEINVLRESSKNLPISNSNVRRESTENVERKPSLIDVIKIKKEAARDEAKRIQTTHLLANAQAEVNLKDAEITRLNELLNLYEKNLAIQAAKEKRLTVDNLMLKSELEGTDVQLKAAVNKETIDANLPFQSTSKEARISKGIIILDENSDDEIQVLEEMKL